MTANELYVKGARVWIADDELVWRGAELLEDYTGQAVVKIQYEEAEESEIKIKDKSHLPHLRNPDILIGENDLTSLSYLNEPEVLYNLQVRFLEQNVIYTYCGIVLVAINPYADLPIYGNEIIQAYSGQDMGAMDPHIFAVAEEAYKKMSRFEQNQSIIVSGESGAGKTVSAKYAMRYFAMVGGSQAETQVEKKVLASNPIMEAIGNAKTTRNDNSSRFGKYIEISFNKKNEIIGAHMRTYLLEKSRVVYQATEERNYHIFYQLCASSDLPELKKLQLLTAEEFYYTAHGGDPIINGVDDGEDLGDTRDALTLLGINNKDQLMIFQIMAGILHFGNVRIKEADGETCEIPAKDKHLNLMCSLLGIDEPQMRMWLCNRKYTTVGEVITKPLTSEQASNAQDALAKHIYAKMFDWIVDKVNIALHSTTKQHRFIGVLDIYGFETFEINSFEQFCINYANEKLQQIFNMHVFKLEQEEYVKEAIEWSFIDFYDNQPCIDLIESKLGILDLLDEECKMPKGSDKNWCQKLYDKHYQKAKHFDKPRMSNTAFIIHHFADKVQYQADGFLEKNRDTVLEDHINLLKASEFELVAELFEDRPDPNEKKQRAGSAPTQPLKPGAKGGKSMKKTVAGQQTAKATVGDQFRDSLFKLMDTLNATTPHYIRCIKPNDSKDAFEFDPKRAVEQLRACGVLETIRISAAGYPSRWTYSEFYQRYRVLARSKDIIKTNPRKTCENILIGLIQDPDKYRFGKTKIFFRAGQVAYLEKLRSDKLKYCGIMIQKHVKGWLQRKRYRKITKSITLLQKFGRGLLARRYAKFLRESWAAKTIQKRWKGFKARRHFLHVRKAVVILQASIRGLAGRREFQRALHNHRAIVLQKYARGWMARVKYRRVIRGIIKLQSHYRRRKARTKLRILKIEAKSVDHIKNVNKGLENKIIQLQQQLDAKSKEMLIVKQQETEIDKMKIEMEKLRGSSGEAEKYSNKVTDLLAEIKALKLELEREQIEKQDLIAEKELIRKDKVDIANRLTEENNKLTADLQEAQTRLAAQENDFGDIVKAKVDAAIKQQLAEFDSERSHHQRLVKEHARLQQRFENLQGDMEHLASPGGHKRTPSDISAISLESYASSVSPEEKKDDEEHEKEDQGYGTEKTKKKKGRAPMPPAVNGETKDIDVGLLLKLQNKVSELEKEKTEMQKIIEAGEENKAPSSDDHGDREVISDSAFNALKQQLVNADDVQLVIKLQKRVKDLELTKSRLRSELEQRDDDEDTKFNITTPEYAYNNLKMQELENENDKLKREVAKLMKAISDSTDFDSGKELSPAGKEFKDQFEAMNDELERRREECLQLRAMMAEKSITTHAIAKESYGGKDDIVNEDNELAMAYRTQKELNRKVNADVEEKDKGSKMGNTPSGSEDEDEKSLTSNYSTRKSALFENKKVVPLIGNANGTSADYLDLVNETSGFWTFDDTVNNRFSQIISENLDNNQEKEHENENGETSGKIKIKVTGLEKEEEKGKENSNDSESDDLELDIISEAKVENLKEPEDQQLNEIHERTEHKFVLGDNEIDLKENLSLIRKSSSHSSLLGLVNQAVDLDSEDSLDHEFKETEPNIVNLSSKDSSNHKSHESEKNVAELNRKDHDSLNETILETKGNCIVSETEVTNIKTATEDQDSQNHCVEIVVKRTETETEPFNDKDTENAGTNKQTVEETNNCSDNTEDKEGYLDDIHSNALLNTNNIEQLVVRQEKLDGTFDIQNQDNNGNTYNNRNNTEILVSSMNTCDLTNNDTNDIHDSDTVKDYENETCLEQISNNFENQNRRLISISFDNDTDRNDDSEPLNSTSSVNSNVSEIIDNVWLKIENHKFDKVNQNIGIVLQKDNPFSVIENNIGTKDHSSDNDVFTESFTYEINSGELQDDFQNEEDDVCIQCNKNRENQNLDYDADLHTCNKIPDFEHQHDPYSLDNASFNGSEKDGVLKLRQSIGSCCQITGKSSHNSDGNEGNHNYENNEDLCNHIHGLDDAENPDYDLDDFNDNHDFDEKLCNHEETLDKETNSYKHVINDGQDFNMISSGSSNLKEVLGDLVENHKHKLNEDSPNHKLYFKDDSNTFCNHKHVRYHSDNNSNEDGAYLTCSDNEHDCLGATESSLRFSQPESGFGETITSDTHLIDNVFHDGNLSPDLLEDTVAGAFGNKGSYQNCCYDNDADWDGGSICGCPNCLGQLRIERIITADKSTMCPDEPPYVLMCEICEELLENQLQKTEKDSKKKEADLKKQLKTLKEENDKQHKVIQQNLQLGPEAKIEATMQHEITRLTSENLDLRESLDKNHDQIRKLKKMLKTYAKRLKDGEAAEIAAEIDRDDSQSVGSVASVKHTSQRNYMGMLEYRKEDEQALVKNLIMDLKPKIAASVLPGLPAYILFMCVRHTDYVNDDEKVRSLLTNTINGIKKCVKKHHSDLDRVTLWLANTCRLLHTLKQYSGEKAFQSDNTSRQNEHCLRNFDLSEYRQVFSDLAVWIYQTLIKQMHENIQQMIVPAVLEHEAIAGLTASKPSGMRGRSSSMANELEARELSLDSLMKNMGQYIAILVQHAVDPELIKQIFRQLYYFLAAGALNNLLLRKDMCNWSKGMQIRYNLSHLEQWLRDNKLQESGALTALEPITQASQLLQARKTDADVDSICEMCSKLTTPQIVKILNLYTPVDEFEERVPISFIRKIQKKLKDRTDSDNTLLMDTKYSYPVTFPFNPSSIALETIDVPEQMHLGFLNRH